ncbi:MAG: hypothetical protein O3C17_12145, partial [Planctomycetota bacterium]|nr:hypothetical protein [Planctomycetota bacterium]
SEFFTLNNALLLTCFTDLRYENGCAGRAAAGRELWRGILATPGNITGSSGINCLVFSPVPDLATLL